MLHNICFHYQLSKSVSRQVSWVAGSRTLFTVVQSSLVHVRIGIWRPAARFHTNRVQQLGISSPVRRNSYVISFPGDGETSAEVLWSLYRLIRSPPSSTVDVLGRRVPNASLPRVISTPKPWSSRSLRPQTTNTMSAAALVLAAAVSLLAFTVAPSVVSVLATPPSVWNDFVRLSPRIEIFPRPSVVAAKSIASEFWLDTHTHTPSWVFDSTIIQTLSVQAVRNPIGCVGRTNGPNTHGVILHQRRLSF